MQTPSNMRKRNSPRLKLYALIGRMRLLSTAEIVEAALGVARNILETYPGGEKDVPRIRNRRGWRPATRWTPCEGLAKRSATNCGALARCFRRLRLELTACVVYGNEAGLGSECDIARDPAAAWKGGSIRSCATNQASAVRVGGRTGLFPRERASDGRPHIGICNRFWAWHI